jgi:aminoglycoside phosphotransferase (APT) family kinase protein
VSAPAPAAAPAAVVARAKEKLKVPRGTSLDCELLSRAEGREVFRFGARESSGALREIVCKRYADPALAGARANSVLEWLTPALAQAQTQTLRCPASHGFDPDLAALWLERLPGEPLGSDASDEQLAKICRLAGRALAELHSLTPPNEAARSLRDHMRELLRPDPRELARAMPERAEQVERAFTALVDWEPRLRSAPVAPLHRDYQLRQLLANGETVGVLDWDDFALGDPAFDVVYFEVYLENHFRSDRAAALAAEFRRSYLAAGGRDPTARVTPYRIFNFLRRACRRLRLRDAGWQGELARMLDSLDAALRG